mmetsp:Transcript_18866/g.55354  ORF Transcript_18866/g.55354 Transcript_18866/m.55354 type:complete len:239 (-) Transcript_18866:256-972(-)
MAWTMRARAASSRSVLDTTESRTAAEALAARAAVASSCAERFSATSAERRRADASSSSERAAASAERRATTERTRSLCFFTGVRRASMASSRRAVWASSLAWSAAAAASAVSGQRARAPSSFARLYLRELAWAISARRRARLAAACSSLDLSASARVRRDSSCLALASFAAWRRKRAFSNLASWSFFVESRFSSAEAMRSMRARIAACSFSERLLRTCSTRRVPSSSARSALARSADR